MADQVKQLTAENQRLRAAPPPPGPPPIALINDVDRLLINLATVRDRMAP
jgi:hypothetical protein